MWVPTVSAVGAVVSGAAVAVAGVAGSEVIAAIQCRRFVVLCASVSASGEMGGVDVAADERAEGLDISAFGEVGEFGVFIEEGFE